MDEIYEARPDAAWELVDGEAIVINFETRHYYCLNKTATAAWSLLTAAPHTADTVSAALGPAYGLSASDVHADVTELLAGLASEGLVEPSENDAASPNAGDLAGGTYVAPRLDKYGTLEQLILAGE
jgi:hypothetical protein